MVKPGQPVSVIPQGDLVITNAALGAQLADPSGRTSVKLTYTRPVKVTSDDESEEEEDDQEAQVETVLCSFTPGKVSHIHLCWLLTILNPSKIEQCTLNLTFEEDDEFLLETDGKKYACLRLLIVSFHLTPSLFSEVHLSGNYIGRTRVIYSEVA